MNMMVNTSELVGSEAEIKRNSETALKRAVSKLVASWERKQAGKATKLGGLGLMAISLAACNSSSDDTTSTPATPATPLPLQLGFPQEALSRVQDPPDDDAVPTPEHRLWVPFLLDRKQLIIFVKHIKTFIPEQIYLD